jgi:hypothetical protein
MESTTPLELSKKYKEDAEYFSNLLKASIIKNERFIDTYEALIQACYSASTAYGVYAAATTDAEIVTARRDVNTYAMQVQTALSAVRLFVV